MPDLAAAKVRLQASLTELEGRLTNIARDLDQPPDRDWDEQAIEIEDDEALEHQAALVEKEIASVQRGLAASRTAAPACGATRWRRGCRARGRRWAGCPPGRAPSAR